MEKFVDLHIHTTYSDGNLSPKEVVNCAYERRLAALSIADHDTTFGIAEAIEECRKKEIELIPAVELSIKLKEVSEEIHLLGYYIDWQNQKLQEILKFLRDKRKERASQIYNKLEILGIKLGSEILDKISANNSSVGRLHFARTLVKQGHVQNISQAFQLYLDNGKPAYVDKIRLEPNEAIQLLLQVNGIPVLAHPYFNPVEPVLETLISYGLKGVEVWHSKHPSTFTQKLMLLAKKLGLLVTGGSDYHGETDNRLPLIGSLKIPYSIVDELKQCASQI